MNTWNNINMYKWLEKFDITGKSMTPPPVSLVYYDLDSNTAVLLQG